MVTIPGKEVEHGCSDSVLVLDSVPYVVGVEATWNPLTGCGSSFGSA